MKPKPKDIGEIELSNITGWSSKYCSCHADFTIAKDSNTEDPNFERIILKKVRCKGNEVTFKVKIIKEGE